MLSVIANKKLNLVDQVVWPHHRSGWRYAISLFGLLHNPNGVMFIGFLDGLKRKVKQPFVGVFHNVMHHTNPRLRLYSPKYDGNSLEEVLSSQQWKMNKKLCRGV